MTWDMGALLVVATILVGVMWAVRAGSLKSALARFMVTCISAALIVQAMR